MEEGTHISMQSIICWQSLKPCFRFYTFKVAMHTAVFPSLSSLGYVDLVAIKTFTTLTLESTTDLDGEVALRQYPRPLHWSLSHRSRL